MATTSLKFETGSGPIETMNILSLNPGSSSLKFGLFSLDDTGNPTPLIRGSLEQLGSPSANLTTTDGTGKASSSDVGPVKLSEAVKHAVDECRQHGTISAVGCRVVHGGNAFSHPTVVDQATLATIKSLAPLHNARDVESIEAARKVLGEISIVAVFDTAFHQTLPKIASTYALPRELIESHHLRRFGFHGISYQYVSERLRSINGHNFEKLVICHLGNGASVCAVRNGQSIDTSMGMTPLEGLVMGTRSGDVDPGLILYLEREAHIHMRELDKMLNSASGLLGLSGLSGDVRELEQAAKDGNRDAKLAIDVFVYRVAKYIGAYAVALQGLSAIAFSGGIGEHSATIRQRVCDMLRFLGVAVSQDYRGSQPIPGVTRMDQYGPVTVWVVKTDEEAQIAKETRSAILGSALQ